MPHYSYLMRQREGAAIPRQILMLTGITEAEMKFAF